MKKLLFTLAGAFALLASSCIEHHATISLNKDGSGTITEETVMGAQAVAMMESMAAMGGEEGGAENPFADMADKAKAEEKAKALGEGVTIKEVKAIDENGRKGARVVYAFEDINKVKFSFGDAMSELGEGMSPDAGEEAAKDEPMAFSYKDGVLTLKNEMDAAGGDEKEEQPDVEEMGEQEMAMAQQMFGDMKMSLKIELPGGIEKTNATHVDGNTVTFMDIDFGKLVSDPEKFKKFAAAQPESPAEMQEAVKGIEGVKVETKEEVTIELK
jgi:hypothetical protein